MSKNSKINKKKIGKIFKKGIKRYKILLLMKIYKKMNKKYFFFFIILQFKVNFCNMIYIFLNF